MNFHFGHLQECREMKVSLNTYLGWDGQLTHRQYTVWALFRFEELNTPTKQEQYLMQINATIARLFAKNPHTIKADDFKLVFKRTGTVDAPMSEDEMKKRIAFSQAMWIGAAGGMKNLTIKDANGNIIKHPEGPIKRRGSQSQQPTNNNGKQAIVGNTPLLQRKPPRRMR